MVSNNQVLLYHITHGKNLADIINANGLVCCNLLEESEYQNIGHISLKAKRARHTVPTIENGNLNDYVPFYFAPRSPMLFAIHKGQVENCSARQDQIIYLVTSVKEITAKSYNFVFTDGHAIMAFSNFYTDTEHLDKIDWTIMESKYWHDTNDDPDRKRRRSAELLVKEKLHWDSILKIGVMNSGVAENVNRMIYGCLHKPDIEVQKEWYY